MSAYNACGLVAGVNAGDRSKIHKNRGGYTAGKTKRREVHTKVSRRTRL